MLNITAFPYQLYSRNSDLMIIIFFATLVRELQKKISTRLTLIKIIRRETNYFVHR